MAYPDPLLAMSDALYGVLTADTTLLSLATGGIYFDVPQDPLFPFVWLELRHDQNFSGFGTQPGRRSRPGVHLRVHVFQSDYGTARDAEILVARIIDLLWNDGAPLIVSGYDVFCDGKPVPDHEEIQFSDEELRGIKVKEFVLLCDYVLEEVA